MLRGELLVPRRGRGERPYVDEPRNRAGVLGVREALLQFVDERSHRRRRDNQRAWSMLRLGEQVKFHLVHVRARRRDHEQVTWPCEPVDPDVARHLSLRLLDVQVARTDDHVDRLDGLGAVGERGDGLSATDRVHPGGARKPASGKHRLVHVAGGTGGERTRPRRRPRRRAR